MREPSQPGPGSWGACGDGDELDSERHAAARNGAPVPGVHGRQRGGTEENEPPIDLVAVQADDELLTALSTGVVCAAGRDGYGGDDDDIIALLGAWKAAVDAQPIPELVNTATALATITAASRPATRRRSRHLVALTGAAAVVVFALGAVSVAAHSAQPGDALFAVTTVLYSQRAQSRQAAAQVQTGMRQLHTSLAAGDTVAAAQEVAQLKQLVGTVDPQDGAPMAAEQVNFLAAKLQETPPGTPTDPTAPLRNGTPPPVAPTTATGTVRNPAASSAPPTPSPTPGANPATNPIVDPRALAPKPPTPTMTPAPTAPPSPPTPTPSPDPTSTPGHHHTPGHQRQTPG